MSTNKEQMNIVIVGHVDHGKSTVIGRLLADTYSLPEGKLQSVKQFCEKNAKPFEYAFLLDALKDEQAQGITIDAARCFFKTEKRDYIIIDAPGHIEFLKNMVTGASRAEAALLVIDAKEGIKENSKRHGHLVSMLGINQVVVLVNKMDMVDYDESAYDDIRNEFSSFLKKINIEPLEFIPISALKGENIASDSRKMQWYNGLNVLDQLSVLRNRKDDSNLPFRLPVQDIYKFTQGDDDRRIIAGTAVTGKIKIGDEVKFYPSKKRSVIKSIETFNTEEKTEFHAGQALGVTLDTQIYIRPGEVMVNAKEKPVVTSTRFRANIFWVGRAPLVTNKTYKLKLGTLRTEVKLAKILNIVDAADLGRMETKGLVERHDVAECVLETSRPVAFDKVTEIESTGRFVIVDNFEISGGGIILDKDEADDSLVLEHIESREYLWDKGFIDTAARQAVNGHKSKFILLTTGEEDLEGVLRDQGKRLEQRLFNRGYKAYYLGFDTVAGGLSTISKEEYNIREEKIRMLGELARILTDAGQIFITSVVNLEDHEIKRLIMLNHPNEIMVINAGERGLVDYDPDLMTDFNNLVESTCQLLEKQEIILEYNL